MTKFDSYPVELSTGMPDINLPLYSLPTRSKDITVNFNLRYHPASVSESGRRMGNCGSGWSFSPGGVIAKTTSLLPGTFYEFNFMGFSGKFMVQSDLNGSNLFATVTETNGAKPVVDILYELDNNGYKVITGYTVYDDLGYIYKFMHKDTSYAPDPINGVLKTKYETFHLSQIYDNNNILLVTFGYEDVYDPVTINGQFRNGILNKLINIKIEGYGYVELSAGSNSTPEGVWITYDQMFVKDFSDNIIQSFAFIHDIDSSSQNYHPILKEVNQYGTTSSEPLTYKFFYRAMPIFDGVSPYAGDYDKYGYYTVTDKACNIPLVDPEHIACGVLEKMTLPTGGCVIYNYEANNYSFDAGMKMGLLANGFEDPNFYYELPENEYPVNLHNYYHNILGIVANATQLPFSVNTNSTVYFKFNGKGKITPGLGGGEVFPNFSLFNTASLTTPIHVFYPGDPSNNMIFSPYGNCNNYGKGRSFPLNGGYIIVAAGGDFPYAEAYTLVRKPLDELGRWWYAGGIRIKAIAYFAESNVPQNYFDLRPETLSFAPAKLTNYKYNLYNDPRYSSGSTTGVDNPEQAYIYYSNVTVYEGAGLGRTEYSFFTPIDFESDGISGTDFKMGKLKSKRVFNEEGIPQLESEYEYEWKNGYPNNYGTTGKPVMGWALPKKVENKEFFPSGAVETKDVFEYYSNNKLKTKTSTTSRSAQALITTNYYSDTHPNLNSIYSKNRIELDSTQKYLGSRLLSVAKIKYLKNWTDYSGNNVSYLPSEMKLSKGTGPEEVKSKITRYDKYGHMLETVKNGITTAYVWGYNNTQIVAEIVNSSYNNIPQVLITAAQSLSYINPDFDSEFGSDPDPAANQLNEGTLMPALNAFRNAPPLKDALVTTYTYKPLIGVSTMTDARGYQIRYEYDSNNRQTAVKDQNGDIVTENVYHTKPQN